MDDKFKARKVLQLQLAFANNVKALRGRRGLTQQQLADMCCMHRVTIANIERTRHEPLFSDACILADALGVSLSDMRQDLSQTPST
jgi:transcriptional regulator with XRE-family HTH domain